LQGGPLAFLVEKLVHEGGGWIEGKS
jgi:hypothetical protein